MITHFLGVEEVAGYLRDLVTRLESCEQVPTVWCAMTDSGVELVPHLVKAVQAVAPDLAETVQLISVYCNDESGGLRFDVGDMVKGVVEGKHILLFDAAVHSGSTMTKALAELRQLGASEVTTYTLVLKQGSHFIPSLWGVMVNDPDRAYFLLESIPNNRLTTHKNDHRPYFHMRHLCEADLSLPPIKSTVASLDRVTWGDRWFDMVESGQSRRTYLLENCAGVVGYLTVHEDSDNAFVIDEVAVSEDHQKKSYGGILMRFADTLARQSDALKIRLNAISNKVQWYGGFGYRVVAGRDPIPLEKEQYVPMERVLLYHLQRHD